MNSANTTSVLLDGEAAFQLYLDGRVFEAQAKCRRLRRANPNDPYASVIEILTSVGAAGYHKSVEALFAVVQVTPANWACRLALGELLPTLGQVEEAGIHLAAAAVLRPNSAKVYPAFARLASAISSLPLELKSRKRSVAITPGDIELKTALGSVLIQSGKASEALIEFEDTTRLMPKSAEVWINCAAALGHLNRLDDSIKAAAKGLVLAPGLAEALANLGGSLRSAKWSHSSHACLLRAVRLEPLSYLHHYNLGMAQIDVGQEQWASASLHRSIELNPLYASAYVNLGAVYEKMKYYGESALFVLKGLVLDPTDPVAYNNFAVAMQGMSKDQAAESFLTRALILRPAYAEARYNRGISRLRLGQHEHGWADYEARFYTAGNTERREFNAPEWVGPGDIAGKRILLYAEQGLGDTIQFARYAYDLSAQGAQVTLMAQAALSDLFGPEIQFATQEDHVGAIDLYAPLMSIPHRQGQTASPTGARGAYLSVPASVVQRWANRLGSKSKRRIGVAFAGNPHHQNDALRSIPLSVFSKIFRHTHLEFHLVQKDFRAGDMESLGQFPNVIVHALQIETLADTAAILMAMDMVITVDTSVLHLSGALGLETLGLIAYAPDWRWQLGSSKTHWYPTVSLMRQEHRDDWSPVMRRIDDQLARL